MTCRATCGEDAARSRRGGVPQGGLYPARPPPRTPSEHGTARTPHQPRTHLQSHTLCGTRGGTAAADAFTASRRRPGHSIAVTGCWQTPPIATCPVWCEALTRANTERSACRTREGVAPPELERGAARPATTGRESLGQSQARSWPGVFGGRTLVYRSGRWGAIGSNCWTWEGGRAHDGAMTNQPPTTPVRPDCESCGADATTNRYDEHNGWQPLCESCAYLARCEAAAIRQGLGEPREALEAARVPVTLEQTGGYTMVLSVPAGSSHVVWITCDGCEDEPYLLALYGVDAQGYMDDEPTDGYRSCDLPDLVDVVREMVAGVTS